MKLIIEEQENEDSLLPAKRFIEVTDKRDSKNEFNEYKKGSIEDVGGSGWGPQGRQSMYRSVHNIAATPFSWIKGKYY